MSFLRTLLMFVFVFLFIGISESLSKIQLSDNKNSKRIPIKSDAHNCLRATKINYENIIILRPYGDLIYVKEAKKRGLDCNVGSEFKKFFYVSGGNKEDNKVVFYNASDAWDNYWSKNPSKYQYLEEAKKNLKYRNK